MGGKKSTSHCLFLVPLRLNPPVKTSQDREISQSFLWCDHRTTRTRKTCRKGPTSRSCRHWPPRACHWKMLGWVRLNSYPYTYPAKENEILYLKNYFTSNHKSRPQPQPQLQILQQENKLGQVQETQEQALIIQQKFKPANNFKTRPKPGELNKNQKTTKPVQQT